MMRRHGAFFLSCLLAFTAGHMFNYTVILYLQEAVGSDWLSGVGFGLAFGSSIVFGWFAGVLCDRVPPHRIIHGAQALFLAGLACLWWAQAGGAAGRVGWTLGGAFLGGLAWSFVGPARLAAIGQMASADELRPATIVFNLQVLVGFGLAPLLIGLVRSRAGWGAVLAVAACGFVAASLLLVRLRTRAVAQGTQASVRSDIRQGFAAVGADPLLAQLMLAAVLGYALTGPLQILLPKLAREVLHLDEVQRGAYLGLLALSLIAGGMSALALARRVHHGRTVLGGIGLGALLFATLGQIGGAPLSALALAGVGLAGGTVLSLVVAGIQAQAPQALRGRVMAMYSITSQVVPALSGVAAGALVQAMSVTQAVLWSGLGLAGLVALAGWRMARLRRHSGHAA
ncbi:MFS transporter [Simplicispira lacusdiani]|uniref:MFS transporter n=1 Tax=Simplicispira lacusdiani TaxID=2213010 RepID=UPI000E720CA8|nr:MFS transporter [Simplicispira lacusdiani]